MLSWAGDCAWPGPGPGPPGAAGRAPPSWAGRGPGTRPRPGCGTGLRRCPAPRAAAPRKRRKQLKLSDDFLSEVNEFVVVTKFVRNGEYNTEGTGHQAEQG